MHYTVSYLSYESTGLFSNLVTDYLNNDEKVKSLYLHRPNLKGIEEAIKINSESNTDRALLVSALKKQYESIQSSELVIKNIDSLLNGNVFTICTAHQPNIFTGHLYFIYKIIHAIKLAEELNHAIPENRFVPIYYMGSEDADLDELGEIFIKGKTYKWATQQKGAFGRMKIDQSLLAMMNELERQLSIEPFGLKIINKIKSIYTEGKTIEQATFEFVHDLFGEYGLVVLLPDNKNLKALFANIAKKELTEQFSYQCVQETIKTIPNQYKVQVAGRDINLFYLKDDFRERIEWNNDKYEIVNTAITFTHDEILQELENYPERFSPNVILRPLFQEMILPNIAFIGGGGELAYWMELKNVFDKATIPYPVLILRNSFSIVDEKTSDLIKKLGLYEADFFESATAIHEKLVKKNSTHHLELSNAKQSLHLLYNDIKAAASTIDVTLGDHAGAMYVKSLRRIESLEKKMIKAEKRKYEDELRQICKIKVALFPNHILQERVDNFLPYYAKWGDDFIPAIYKSSKGLEQEFCIMSTA